MLTLAIPEALAYKLSSRVQLNANPALCHQDLLRINRVTLTGEHWPHVTPLFSLFGKSTLYSLL
jgi:hypothetical protein